jgi:hypothetical protein
MSLFPQIYSVLWQLFIIQHSIKDATKEAILQRLANVGTTDLDIPLRFQLINVGTTNLYILYILLGF